MCVYWGREGDIESTDNYIGGWNPHLLRWIHIYAIQIHIRYSDTHTLFRYTYPIQIHKYAIQIHIRYSDTQIRYSDTQIRYSMLESYESNCCHLARYNLQICTKENTCLGSSVFL